MFSFSLPLNFMSNRILWQKTELLPHKRHKYSCAFLYVWKHYKIVTLCCLMSSEVIWTTKYIKTTGERPRVQSIQEKSRLFEEFSIFSFVDRHWLTIHVSLVSLIATKSYKAVTAKKVAAETAIWQKYMYCYVNHWSRDQPLPSPQLNTCCIE